MRRWQALALITIGCLAVVVSGCGRQGTGPAASAEADEVAATPVAVTTAVRGTIERQLELSGTVETETEADVVAEVAGKVAAVQVDVGEHVRRGEPLVTLDRELVTAESRRAAAGIDAAQAGLDQTRKSVRLTEEQTAIGVKRAEAAVESARERLASATVNARMTEKRVNSEIEQARQGLQSAETRLEEIKAGARRQELRQAQAQVKQAESRLKLAEQTFQRHKRLLDEGVISQQQMDQVRTEYEVAQQQHTQALEALSLVEEGARTEEVRLAEIAVETAQERVRLAEAGRDQVEMAQREVEVAEKAVQQAEQQLRSAIADRQQVDLQRSQAEAAAASVRQAQAAHDLVSTQLSKHTVTAPASGTISRRLVDPGEAASPGVPLLTIVNNELLYVEVGVSEADLKELHVGQPATITVDALPGVTFEGTISAVNPAVATESRTGSARVRFAAPGGQVRTGMFARATVVVERHSDTILLDRDALVTEGDETFAFVVEDGHVRRTAVR
ncbi:MAG: efflux RND transporter periplasmic adaptor subunit, partial [Armatimonadota bacterium]|nr:efflux RND transporter periplasmic adaptor subunit [Armatimonadota bacterium]